MNELMKLLAYAYAARQTLLCLTMGALVVGLCVGALPNRVVNKLLSGRW